MQMLQDIVDASKETLDHTPKRHLVVPAIADSLESYGIDMIGHETTVGPTGVSDGLAQHAPEQSFESVVVAVIVVPHALNGASDSCVSAGNLYSSVEEVQVGQLAIYTVIDDVQLIEALSPGSGRIVYSNGSLERSSLDGKRGNSGGIMRVMVSINPGLRSKSAV